MVSRSIASTAVVLLLLASNRLYTDECSRPRGSESEWPIQLTSAAESVSQIQVREGFGHIYRGSQEYGELQLHRLAQVAEREDAWIYVEELWIDIGHDEQPKGVLCSWEVIQSLSDIYAGNNIVWYHIHPKNSNSEGIHPPSIEDIFALARLKMLCEDSFSQRLTGKVFDGFGVWDVDLSLEVQRQLYPRNASVDQGFTESIDPRDVVKLRGSPKRRAELARLAFYFNHERRVQDILEKQNLERNERIRHFVLSVREIGLLLEYCELD